MFIPENVYQFIDRQKGSLAYKEASPDRGGNARVIVHFSRFVREDEQHLSIDEQKARAEARAKKMGFKPYKGRDFGGGYVGCGSIGIGLYRDIYETLYTKKEQELSHIKSEAEPQKINRDINGNSRVTVRFYAFLKEVEFMMMSDSKALNLAKKRAKTVGFKTYRGKSPGRFVGQEKAEGNHIYFKIWEAVYNTPEKQPKNKKTR